MSHSPLDKKRIAMQFDKAAAHYDQAAFIQREIGKRLEERLDDIKLSPHRVMDLGCGTGKQLEALAKRYPAAEIVAVDHSVSMLQQADKLGNNIIRVSSDAERLPFPDHSFDLIFSNLMFQWCDPLLPALSECFRLLKEGGLIMFSTLGPDTLQELRYCWSQIDKAPHVNTFLDMHPIGDMLLKVSFSDPVMDMEYITATYKDVMSMMKDLQTIGATNADSSRRKTLTGKNRFKQLAECYQPYALEDNRLPMTYEVIYGHAWKMKPAEKTAIEAYVRVEDITFR